MKNLLKSYQSPVIPKIIQFIISSMSYKLISVIEFFYSKCRVNYTSNVVSSVLFSINGRVRKINIVIILCCKYL